MGDYLLDDVKIPSPIKNPLPDLAPKTPMVATTNGDNTTSFIVAPLNKLDTLALANVALATMNSTRVV